MKALTKLLVLVMLFGWSMLASVSSVFAQTPQQQPPAEQASVEQASADQAPVVQSTKFVMPELTYENANTMLHRYVIPAVAVILLLIVAYLIAKWLGRLMGGLVTRRIDATLGKFLAKVTYYIIMIFTLLGILQFFGFGIATFAAVLAAAGFAIGLAFQGTLSNFSAGIMLLVFRPFKVGDAINVAGVFGIVHEIDLFVTKVNTFDNRRLVVPNSSIFGSTIENLSHNKERRVDVNVGVSYGADLNRTREVLEQAAAALPDVIQGEGRGTQVVLGDLGDSAVNWTVRAWVQADVFWPQKQELTRLIKQHLDEAKLSIPFPQIDVHVIEPVKVDNNP